MNKLDQLLLVQLPSKYLFSLAIHEPPEENADVDAR